MTNLDISPTIMLNPLESMVIPLTIASTIITVLLMYAAKQLNTEASNETIEVNDTHVLPDILMDLIPPHIKEVTEMENMPSSVSEGLMHMVSERNLPNVILPEVEPLATMITTPMYTPLKVLFMITILFSFIMLLVTINFLMKMYFFLDKDWGKPYSIINYSPNHPQFSYNNINEPLPPLNTLMGKTLYQS